MFDWTGGRMRFLGAAAALVLALAACGSDDGAGGGASTSAAPAVTEAAAEPEAGGASTSAAPPATEAAAEPSEPEAEAEPLSIVATTTILGSIAANVAGADAEVVVLLPTGADPHDYQPSAAQVALLQGADLVVANGLLLEEGMVDVLAAAEADGANLFEAAEFLDPLPYSDDGHGDEEHDGHEHEGEGAEHEEHEGEDGHEHEEGEHEGEDGHEHEEGEHEGEDDGHEHEDEDGHEHEEGEDHEDEDGHEHEGEGEHDHEEGEHRHGDLDPHFWMDPLRVAEAARLIAAELAALDPTKEWQARAEAYAAELGELDEEIQGILAAVPAGKRKLLTNHDSLSYFADRYGFEIIGTVIPGGSTLAEPSSAGLARLVEVLEEEGVDVIFAETTEPTALAEALAAEADSEVQVVEMYTGSLGEPGSGADTLIGMLRTNARLIADALTAGG